ncbi:MAG TPA: DUF3634 family protein [Candidatus Limnocylindria bacterium]|nr:DUF3634 family protein [Candidatus Limnocylindria bacterium]
MGFLARLVDSLRRTIAPPLFVIDIRAGTARARRGQVPAGLLSGIADVARDLDLRSGTVYGMRRPQGITLGFSDDIPEHAHQRLRNILATQRHRIPGG